VQSPPKEATSPAFRFLSIAAAPVGAITDRPVVLVQNHIAQGDHLRMISSGNPDPCFATIGRALNKRPYGTHGTHP